MSYDKKIIVIFGPTAVGKTDFAQTLATRISGEIVNADLGQFYEPLSIGTAKPDWRNAPARQHLFDIIHDPIMINVALYRQKALETFTDIWSRGNIPIVVGGSGFYIKSLFCPPRTADTITSSVSTEHMTWQDLYAIDPVRAESIHPHDHYRIQRALHIYYSTGKKPSELKISYQPISNFYFVYLTRDRADLYSQINGRTEIMLKMGWIDEVKNLNASWQSFLKKKKIIGYDDILHYLEHEDAENKNALIAIIAQKTRNYAKRQITFGNQLYKELQDSIIKTGNKVSACMRFNLTCGDFELYINQLLDLMTKNK